jgi:hypothetical protein
MSGVVLRRERSRSAVESTSSRSRSMTVELPGMPPTVGYLSLRSLGVEKIAQLLIKKLQAS